MADEPVDRNLKLNNQSPSGRLERQRLTSLINSMADGVVAIDEAGKIIISNGAMSNILDLNITLVGKLLWEVFNLLDDQNKPLDLKKIIEATKSQTISRDWRLKYNDGSVVNLYVSIAAVHLGFGVDGTRGHVLLTRDITREKSLEEERDEFISVVSHELRTPITIAEGMIGNAQYLYGKTTTQDKVIAAALKTAHDQITFLAGMMNDLATLSRAERGVLTIEVEPINVIDLVKSLVHAYTPQASAKNLTIETTIDPSVELLTSSKLYTKEILQNLLTNAIKYTEKGQVTIGAKAKPNGVEFFVTDTGIGISKTDQEMIFDKFFRSEDFRTRQNNGTGLGLYVTMKLARLLKTDISVESVLNEGSTFRVFIANATK